MTKPHDMTDSELATAIEEARRALAGADTDSISAAREARLEALYREREDRPERPRYLTRRPRVGDVVETVQGSRQTITERVLSPLGGRVTLYGTVNADPVVSAAGSPVERTYAAGSLPNAFSPAEIAGVLRSSR